MKFLPHTSTRPILSGALFASLLACVSLAAANATLDAQFENEIRPALVKLCGDCHQKKKNDVPFLKAVKLDEINSARWAWRSAVSQLRNRTMPPVDEIQPTEAERLRLATWIESTLRQSAVSLGEYAGAPVSRRLNRLEYDNTIRDLVGLELNYSETFPTEGGGGEGFANNGETLFLPVILMERYLEAAQQILDTAILTPPLRRAFPAKDFAATAGTFVNGRLAPNDEASVAVSILNTGDYEVGIAARTEVQAEASIILKVDGIAAHRFKATDAEKPNVSTLRFQRGVHQLTLTSNAGIATLASVTLSEKQAAVADIRRAAHQRIFGSSDAAAFAAKTPAARRAEAERIIGAFARRAFRAPVPPEALERILQLYARSAERGEPFEQSVKLALKAVLVSSPFLFRVETDHEQPGVFPLSDDELASRLSYFLWASMPDEELFKLADEKKLGKPEVLAAQVERMLASPKSRAFIDDFTGQWLGTKEVGASVAFTSENLKGIYSSELAADLRGEPIQLMTYLLAENHSLLELINANYAFVTERTAKHYGMDVVKGDAYHRVEVSDGRRGGVCGLGAVHMITSYPDRTSPVLRGAWILETMLGVRVPSPPPDVPPLEATRKKQKGATLRAVLEKHRANPSCAACHNLLDPIGFGLENFDLLGRWRDTDGKQPIDASGVLPSGEKINGPKELKQVLLGRKDEFVRHFSGKMLGYALGRSLEDRDDGTIEKLAQALEHDQYRARTLIREIVLSAPFRNRQGGEEPRKNATPKKKKEIPAAKEK